MGWTPAVGCQVDVAFGATKTSRPMGYRSWVNIGDVNTLKADASALYHGSGSASTLSGGAIGTYYRLRVDMLTGAGEDPSQLDSSGQPYGVNLQALKYYSVRVVAPSAANDVDGPTANQCAGCTVAALNDMGLFSEVDGSSGLNPSLQLLNIPSSYAGQQVTINVFDPGDLQVPVAAPATPTTAVLWPSLGSKGQTTESIHLGQFPNFSMDVRTTSSGSVCPDAASPMAHLYAAPTGTATVGNPAGWTDITDEVYCTAQSAPRQSLKMSWTGWTAGTWDVYAHYDGDSKYGPSDTEVMTVNVDANTSYCYVTYDTTSYPTTKSQVGGNITLQGDIRDGTYPPDSRGFGPDYILPPNPNGDTTHPGNDNDLTGIANIYDNGTLLKTLTLKNLPSWSYSTSISTSAWTIGSTHTLTVVYPGGQNATYPRGCMFTLPTLTATPKLTLDVTTDQASYVAGQTITFTATITTSNGSAVPSGPITITITGNTVCSGTISGGPSPYTYTCTASSAGLTNGSNSCAGDYVPSTTNINIHDPCSFTISGGATPAPTPTPTPTPSPTAVGGGAAYSGGYIVRPIPNWRPHSSNNSTGSAIIQTKFTKSSILKQAATSSILIDFLAPDGSAGHVVSVKELGPSINANNSCLTEPPSPTATACSTPSDPVQTIDAATGRPYYNGQWLQFTLQVPASYSGGTWSLSYTVQGAISTQDALTVAVNMNSSPVHLLPQKVG